MIVLDDFIKDKNALIKDINSFFEGTYDYGGESVEDEISTVNSWDWIRPPKNKQEELISYLLNNSPLKDINKIKTIEYWTHIHTQGSDLEWHTNKDEALRHNTGEFKHPLYSIIYYPINVSVEGGFLEISGVQEKNIYNDGSFLKFEREYERIKPKYNRVVIFYPSYLHRVTNIKRGIRYSIAIDIWDRKLEKL